MTGKDNDRTPVLPWSFNNDHALIEDADGNAVLTNISEDVGPFIVETCNTHASLKSTVDRLREALKRCIDDILAKATFDATPKFIAERSPVVVQARAALADVPAPVTPSADVERLRGALEKTVDCLKFYVKREGESPYRDACSDVRGIDELIEARAALTASAAPSTEV